MPTMTVPLSFKRLYVAILQASFCGLLAYSRCATKELSPLYSGKPAGVVQIPPHASPGLFNSVKVSDANLARDCVFSALAAGEMGKSHGLHMLLYGAYESTQQNPSWHWDPVMFQLGQFDGSLFHPQHAAVRCEVYLVTL